MKQAQYATRDEVTKLLVKRGFKEAEASNKNVNIYYKDRGRVIVRMTPACHTEIVSDGMTVAQFKQPIFDIEVLDNKIIVMVGTDENKCYMNLYIPRRRAK